MPTNEMLEFFADAESLTWDNFDLVIPSIIEQYYTEFRDVNVVYQRIFVFHISGSEIESTFSKEHEKALLKRIYHFDTLKQQRDVQNQLKEVADRIIKFLVKKELFSYQRSTKLLALKKFLISLLTYKNFHDGMSHRQNVKYNLWRPGHLERRNKGLYPLSRKQLREWHGHYNEVLPMLIKAHIVEKSNYGYWAKNGNGICLYYKINIEKFSKINSL